MANKRSLPMESFKKELLKQIKKHDTIIIHRPKIFGTHDCSSAQAALKNLLKVLYPEKKVLIVGELDNYSSRFIDMDTVNEEDYKNALTILLQFDGEDNPHKNIIGDHWDKGDYVARICMNSIPFYTEDTSSRYHPDNLPEDNVDLELLLPAREYESICELLAVLFEKEIDDAHESFNDTKTAQFLYLGVRGYPQFVFPRFQLYGMAVSSKDTMDIILRNSDDKEIDDIYDRLTSKGFNEVRLVGRLLEDFNNKGFLYPAKNTNGLATVLIDQELLQEYDLTHYDMSPVDYMISKLPNNIISTRFVEKEDGSYKGMIGVNDSSLKEKIKLEELLSEYSNDNHIIIGKISAFFTVPSRKEVDKIITILEEKLKEIKE